MRGRYCCQCQKLSFDSSYVPALCRYVYTSSDVQKIIEEKRAKGSLGHAAAERARLIALRDAAQETGNFEEAELYALWLFVCGTRKLKAKTLTGTCLASS